jgi:UDP-glucose 4-epimerase
LVEANVADDDKVRGAIRDHGVRAIMHFAGSVVVPESVSDPLKYYRNNTAATRSLIESAVAEGVPHFIFSSTAATYGNPAKVPIVESDPTQPINPYGMSKLMTEAMLKDVAFAHPMNYCALRYFNVAGADPQGRSGQSTVGATHLIKIAVEAATGKRQSVGVFGTDFATRDGTGIRDYIHVSDLAAAHVSALELLVANPAESHTLNCGYGRGFSVLEVLDAVDRVTNMTIQRDLQGRRPGDPAELVADNGAILAALPWRPQRDNLDTIVQDALAWERTLAERQGR